MQVRSMGPISEMDMVSTTHCPDTQIKCQKYQMFLTSLVSYLGKVKDI